MDFKDNNVVKVPAPAIKGKAIGTTSLTFLACLTGLKSSMFKIISIAIKKITIAPAIEKDFKSIPINFNIPSPVNKKINIIKVEIQVTLIAFI